MADSGDFLFDRRVSLLVAFPLATDYRSISGQVVEVQDLRVQFKIEKSLEKDPNTAEISITNLAESTRSQMQTQSAKIILRAGYLNTLGQIFVGDALTIDHG